MKLKLTTLTLLVGMFAAQSSFAACARPEGPEIPSGDTASAADMMKAKKAVESYLADIEKYITCGVSTIEEKRAQGDMEKVGDRYNKELRTYKAKS